MRTRVVTAVFLATLMVASSSSAFGGPQKSAQSGDPGTVYQPKAKPDPKPAKPRPRPRASAPKLALHYRLVKREQDQSTRDVDTATPLKRGDAVRLLVRAEEDGYLYVLHQEEGKKPSLLFPDKRINNGQNFVSADAEYNIPAYCSDEKGAPDCWLQIARQAGRGYLIVILSRDRRNDIVNDIVQRGPVAFDQSRDVLVDPAGQRLAKVDAKPVRSTEVSLPGSFEVNVTDSNPTDGRLVEVIPLTVIEAERPIALQWRLVKRERDGSVHDINSVNALTAGDDVRLLCRADQDGYLYVFQQDEGGKPVVLFPDARINDGRNFVAAEQEYSVPAYCADEKAGGENCWDRITKTPGRSNLIVLFTTERGTDLFSRIQAAPVALDPVNSRIVDKAGQLLVKLDTRVAQTQTVAARPGFPVRVANSEAGDKQIVDVVPLTIQPRVPPLALQWRLTRREKTGNFVEGDPSTTFFRNDELRLVCKPARDGYLYVLFQEQGQKPIVVFPDTRINNGQNFVAADQEYNVPAYCPEGRGAENCWQRLTRRPGRNLLIVIYSREKNTELFDKIRLGGPINIDQVASGQVVDSSAFVLGLVNPRERVKASSQPVFVVESVDTDPNSNEQLIDAFVINVDRRTR